MSLTRKTRVKSLTKNKTENTRIIDTTLMNKEEVFRMLCLAEVCGLPLLLIGLPGVAKTKAVLEYSKAFMAKNLDPKNKAAVKKFNQEFLNKIYILETDEGTKTTEVKGMPDMEALLTKNQFQLVAPITEADVIVVNEIDKAPTSIRNSLLGIMNEHFLFSGKNKLYCVWKLFIGTCNEIPKEERNSPFWDRFVLKMQVSRLSVGEIMKYFSKGGREYRESFQLGIPTKAEMDAIQIPLDKLEKFIDVVYNYTSDRTVTYVPDLVKAVAFIWNQSVDAAMVKVCSMLVSDSAATDLKDKLLSNAMKTVLKKVDDLRTCSKQEEVDDLLKDIGSTVTSLSSAGEIVESDVDDIQKSINYILDNLSLKEEEEVEEVVEEEFEPIDLE